MSIRIVADSGANLHTMEGSIFVAPLFLLLRTKENFEMMNIWM